jgi:TonB family protein
MKIFYKLAFLAALVYSCGASSQTVSAPETDTTKTQASTSVAAVITPGRLVHKEDPKYPKEARKQKLQGQVVLRTTINESGNVTGMSVVSGDPVLGSSALQAALKFKFEPFTQEGHAVAVRQDLTFEFVPDRKTAELSLPLPAPSSLQSEAASHPPITIPNTRPSGATSSAPHAPSGRPITGGVYRVGGGVSAPRVLYSPDPEYSDEARRAKYEGTCVLSLIVGPDGLPRDIRVARSLGMGLDEKAIEAVRQWRFQPAMKDGQPVTVAINVEVSFRL